MKKIPLALACLLLMGGAVYSSYSRNTADFGYADGAEEAYVYDGEKSDWAEGAAPRAPEILSQAPPLGIAGIFEIRDKFFIQQCNDIYLNPDKYMGRMVKLEGIYDEFKNEEKDRPERYVIRYGPGCCGNDGVAGFEFFYDGQALPKQDDWIEVTGTVDMITGDDGEEYLVLAKSDLKVMAKRGREFVEN